jgi:asparaginyl-tRNA synthetase
MKLEVNMWIEIKKLLASDTPKKGVIVRGWVRTFRKLKDIYFMEVNDGSCLSNIQIVLDQSDNFKMFNNKNKEITFDEVKKITTGSSVEIIGDLVASPAKGQKWEIKPEQIKIYNIADPEKYPLQKKRHSFEFLRTIGHLRVRTNTFGAVFRVRSALAYAIHKFFIERGFYYLNTPIITASDAEGAGEMFQVTTLDFENILKNILKDEKLIEKYKIETQNSLINWKDDFFGKKAFLTVSGQLEAETFAIGLGKVYTFGPTFRAENSNTSRHLAEFWMVEPEMAFYEIKDNMDLGEEFIKYIINYVFEHNMEDIEFFNKWIEKGLIDKLENILNEKFERITYTDAIDILLKSNKNFEYKVEWGIDLQSEHERYITEEYFKKPVFVTDYPAEIKAFYMKQNDDGKTVRAMDLLVPQIGEIIGGSQREDDYDKLINAIKKFNLNIDNYWWYLDLRKFGSVPHSGFGLGFERMVQFVTGMKNIRDVIPYHRTPGWAEF